MRQALMVGMSSEFSVMWAEVASGGIVVSNP